MAGIKPGRGSVILYDVDGSGENRKPAVVESALTKEETREAGMYGQMVRGLDLDTGKVVERSYDWSVCSEVSPEIQEKANQVLAAYDKQKARVARAESLVINVSDDTPDFGLDR